MNVEVIAIGTELLLGQIVNTNLATIGQALAEAGLDTHRQVVVGDNLDRLSEAIREGLAQSDAIILTGSNKFSDASEFAEGDDKLAVTATVVRWKN